MWMEVETKSKAYVFDLENTSIERITEFAKTHEIVNINYTSKEVK